MNWDTFKKFCDKHELPPRDILEMIYTYLLENGEEPELFEEVSKFFSSDVMKNDIRNY